MLESASIPSGQSELGSHSATHGQVSALGLPSSDKLFDEMVGDQLQSLQAEIGNHTLGTTLMDLTGFFEDLYEKVKGSVEKLFVDQSTTADYALVAGLCAPFTSTNRASTHGSGGRCTSAHLSVPIALRSLGSTILSHFKNCEREKQDCRTRLGLPNRSGRCHVRRLQLGAKGLPAHAAL